MKILKYKKKFKKKKHVNIKKEFLGLCKFGFYGIKALKSAFITINQVEVSRRIIIRLTKRVGKVYIRVVFSYPITAKSHGSRMGRGIGNIKGWVAFIKKGSIFIEMLGISKELATQAFKFVSYRLPIKINFITRDLV